MSMCIHASHSPFAQFEWSSLPALASLIHIEVPHMGEEIGVGADGTFVAAGGAPTQRPASRARRREAQKEEEERAKRDRKRSSAKGGKKGVNPLHMAIFFMMFGPAIFPIAALGFDALGNTSLGVAAYESCIAIGMCSTYHDQLTAIYQRENPKKVKGVASILKKWRGKEAQLIKEVEAKYENVRRLEQIRKDARERDDKEQRASSEESRGKRGKKSPSAPSPSKPSKTKAADGWDDSEASYVPDEVWDDEPDLETIMG